MKNLIPTCDGGVETGLEDSVVTVAIVVIPGGEDSQTREQEEIQAHWRDSPLHRYMKA